MALNFPGPYEVEISYTTDGLGHKMRLNCDVVTEPSVGDAANTIELVRRNGAPCNLVTAVSDFIATIIPHFNTADSFDEFIFYKYAPLSNERTFITSDTIGTNGTSASASGTAHQQTLTFRTAEGNNMRIVLLESVNVDNDRQPYATLGPQWQAIFDYVTADTNWILARDTSYPLAAMAKVGGQNEALFRTRYR